MESLICILQGCRKKKKLVYAKHVHACVCNNGLETRGQLENYLVPLFVECGSMLDAQRAFHRLANRNEYSWTSLIQGYMEYGDPEHALELFQDMQEDRVSPNKYTFIALLKACAMLNNIDTGRQIHAQIAQEAPEIDVFVGCALVNMYAKCGSVNEAKEVFEQLPLHSAVAWTTLITGYVDYGLGEEALNCLEKMQLEGICPDLVTFVCSLRACGSTGALNKGRELHAQVFKQGFERGKYVVSTVVDMYAKCGSLSEAQDVFDELMARDIVLWNTLISGYAEQGLVEEVLRCFEQMRMEGILPNSVTYVCTLKGCGRIGAFERGQDLHAQLVKEGLERDLVVCNALVDMYSKCDLLGEAYALFDEMPIRNVVSWTALLSGYAKHGLGEEALNCLNKMQLEGVSANEVTYIFCLKACSGLKAIGRGRKLHAEIAQEGFSVDPYVGSSLVDFYAKCGVLTEAQEVFDELTIRNIVSWNALISGYAEQMHSEEVLMCFEQMRQEGMSPDAVSFSCSLKACSSIGTIDGSRDLHAEIVKEGLDVDPLVGNALIYMYAKCGLLAEAQQVFNHLSVPDVAAWTAFIGGYAEHGLDEEVIMSLENMQLEGICLDAVTVVCSLKGCGIIGAERRGRKIHSEVAKDGFDEDPSVGNALVTMYAKCGLLIDAEEMFEELPRRDIVSWNALIAGYACLGESRPVFKMFERMRDEGVWPDSITLLSVLTVCSHEGLVDEGQTFFQAAVNQECCMNLSTQHYNCMVDILGRAGQLDEAVAVVEGLPCQPNLVTWSTVLGACRKSGSIVHGRQAFELAMRFDENQAVPYVLMVNIYSDFSL